MEVKIINNTGKEVFYLDSKMPTDILSEKFEEFKSYASKGLKSAEFIMEDNMDITDLNNAFSDGDGEGVVKIQILNLK